MDRRKGFVEPVIEWHDADDEVSYEVGPACRRRYAERWLKERVDLTPDEPGQVIPVDEHFRITDSLDNDRWCYYRLRPTPQMGLL